MTKGNISVSVHLRNKAMTPHISRHQSLLSELAQMQTLPVMAHWTLVLTVVLCKWRHNHRTRIKLAGFTDDQLRDIGITRAQAYEESKQPFWR